MWDRGVASAAASVVAGLAGGSIIGGGGALPAVVVVGGMKCGTTALHRYLDLHPDIAMSEPKELNFFFGAADGEPSWTEGNWSRGVGWYRSHFAGTASVHGESSPGYTSPDHPETAQRMAGVVPEARLLYLVRDPLDRALSQYRHHRRDGDERRPAEQALLDPESQYIARSRYHERLEPFLDHYRRDRILVVRHRDLLERRRETVRSVFAFLGVDDGFWSSEMDDLLHTARRDRPPVPAHVEERFRGAVLDDLQRLSGLGVELPL